MTDGFKDKLWRAGTMSLLAIIVLIGAYTAWPTYLRGNSVKAEDARLSQQIEEKKREIERLRDFQRRFRTDPDLVERIARQNGRVYPGELVFTFED